MKKSQQRPGGNDVKRAEQDAPREEEVRLEPDLWLHAREAEAYFNRRARDGWRISYIKGNKVTMRRDPNRPRERYRVEPFLPTGGYADSEQNRERFLQSRADAGWARVGERDRAYLFADETGNAQEIAADPAAQIRTLRRLRRRALFALAVRSAAEIAPFVLSAMVFSNFGMMLISNAGLLLPAMVLIAVGLNVRKMLRLIADSNRSIAELEGWPGLAPEPDANFEENIWSRFKEIALTAFPYALALLLLLLLKYDSKSIIPERIQPLPAPPYTVETVYGVEPSESNLEQRPTTSSLFVPGQWEYVSIGGGYGMKCTLLESRWEWVAEQVYDHMSYIVAAPLDQEALDDLALDEGSLSYFNFPGLTLFYRDGALCASITVDMETFEPGSPLYEAVKNRGQSSR